VAKCEAAWHVGEKDFVYCDNVAAYKIPDADGWTEGIWLCGLHVPAEMA
jgi:hypothetical protein